MIKFNDNNIITGHIKQLLATFNLPHLQVYKKGETFLYENGIYIKDNAIQAYENGDFKNLIPFNYNKYIPNYTDNLKISSLVYDSHTHEYLGEYLRFIRDYKKVDLMSMYNCFSNNLVDNLVISWGDNNYFTTEDDSYKVYCLPVKLNKKYTIALSSGTSFEMICALYSKTLLESDVPNSTYKKVSQSSFEKPFIYDNLTKDELQTQFLYEHEKDLKMFIKLPVSNNTSIVILEGEYLNTNTKVQNKLTKNWEHSSTVINYTKEEPTSHSGYPKVEYAYNADENKYVPFVQDYTKTVENDKIKDIKLVSSLQLLQLNTNYSYPFADRLIEYLVDNVITEMDNIPDNINRVQEQLFYRYVNNIDPETNLPTKVGIHDYKYKGIWEDKYKAVGYDLAKETGILNTEFDILGYIDKDVESKLGPEIDIYKEE